jgi:hypothetical protein
MLYRLEELGRARLPLLIVQSNDCPTPARRYFLTDLTRLSPCLLEVTDHPRTAIPSGDRSDALPSAGPSSRLRNP